MRLVLGKSAGKFALLMAAVVAVLCLYVMLSDKPFGGRFAISVGYTLFAFFYVFFRWRGLPESYSLRDKRVQHQLPRLVMMHLAFLTILLAGLSDSTRQWFPDSWMVKHGPKHDSYYELAMILFSTLTFFTQVLISRHIVKKCTALEEHNSLNTDWRIQ